MVVMTFGKHKDKPLCDLPTPYLQWLATIVLKDEFRHAVQTELRSRMNQSGDAVAGIVRQWFREIVMKHHPDNGGSKEALKAVIDAHSHLREMLAS